MKNNDQRDMIEQLLGITELSEKAEVLKARMRDTQRQYQRRRDANQCCKECKRKHRKEY